MKFLLTNDDGWDADGLNVLQQVAGGLGEVWVVAPAQPMSGISHQITFEQPMRLEERGPNVFSLTGTPADCVRVARSQLDVDFDWVLSGINNGANLGSDIYVSGTYAATREAALHGFRSIALSQHRRKFGLPFNWTKTLAMAERFLPELIEDPTHQPQCAINVNFPDKFHVDEEKGSLDDVQLTVCELDRNPLPADFKRESDGSLLYCSQYSDRARTKGCDIDVCFNGEIAVTKSSFA